MYVLQQDQFRRGDETALVVRVPWKTQNSVLVEGFLDGCRDGGGSHRARRRRHDCQIEQIIIRSLVRSAILRTVLSCSSGYSLA